MEKETAAKFIGVPVRISLGDKLFSPPPGTIEEVTEKYFVFTTRTKTTVLDLSELREINPI